VFALGVIAWELADRRAAVPPRARATCRWPRWSRPRAPPLPDAALAPLVAAALAKDPAARPTAAALAAALAALD
jgi:hypothetical protein